MPKLLQILGAGVVTIGLVGRSTTPDSRQQYPGGLIADRVCTTRAFVLFSGWRSADAAHGGRTVESDYLVRNLFVIPTSFVGGLPFRQDPHWPFLAGRLIAALGCAVFVLERPRR